MIKTSNLTFNYPGERLLSFPDLKVERKQTLVVCGESGCGKTTLLYLLAGLRQPKTGTIHFNNKAFTRLSPAQTDQFRGRNIGIIYQSPHFIEALSILDNLLLSPHVIDPEKAIAVANRLHIEDCLVKRPNQLSEGQKQRASIARAIMNQPKLLLADEPTSALDDKHCSQVIRLLKEEALTNNAALIIVTHDKRLKTEVDDHLSLDAF